MASKKKPTIVVFGGTGFIGSNFSNFALARGAQVVACGGAVPPNSVLDSAVDVVEFDAADLAATLRFMHQAKPDAVVFCISAISPRAGTAVDPAAALSELRCLGNAVQGMNECGTKQIVFCSSGGAIYGDKATAHLEADICLPKSLYGKLKVSAESLLTTLCGPLGMRAAIMRIGNPYGPGQSPFGLHGVISVFVHKMLMGEPIKVFGSLDAAKDYIYVDDVSNAMQAAIDQKVDGIFNIASGEPVSLRVLVDKIAAACGVHPKIEFTELAATEVSTFSLDIGKAKQELAWLPTVNLDHGIGQMKRWIEKTYLPNVVSHPS